MFETRYQCLTTPCDGCGKSVSTIAAYCPACGAAFCPTCVASGVLKSHVCEPVEAYMPKAWEDEY